MTEPEERLDVHDQFYAPLLDTVRDDRYPSIMMRHRLVRIIGPYG